MLILIGLLIYLLAGRVYQGVCDATNETSAEVPWFAFLVWPLYLLRIIRWWPDV